MLDKSVLDFQLTEVFGQYGLEAREFDLLCELFSTGKASVPTGQFPGLLVKGILVALSFPGVVITFYSKDEEVQKVSGRLGEVGVDCLGVIGEATPAKDIERTFVKAFNGQLSLLFIHSSLSIDQSVIAGYENLARGNGISACFLTPEMFHRVEVQEWAQVYAALSTSFPEHCKVPLMELGGLAATEGAAGSFDLSEAEKQAIFSPLDGEDEDEEEFMRTVIRTSPFHNNPSGPPVELKPIQMPTGDGRVQDDEPESSEHLRQTTPLEDDPVNGFQSMNSILGRATGDSDEESDAFLKARSQVSVKPPSASGDELEGESTSRLDNLFNTWAGEVHTAETATGNQTLIEFPSSGIDEVDDDDDDDDELEVMLVEGDDDEFSDEDDDDDSSSVDDESELEDLISVLDMEEPDTVDEAESRENLAKSVTQTFPTFGDFEPPEKPANDIQAGSVTSVMLPSEAPERSLDQRTGAVTSIILPGDIELEEDEEFIEDDLADLLGSDMEDELLTSAANSEVAESTVDDSTLEDDDDDDDDLLGLLDTIVGGTAPKFPDSWAEEADARDAAALKAEAEAEAEVEAEAEIADAYQQNLPDTHIEYLDDDDYDEDDPDNIEAAMRNLAEIEMMEQGLPLTPAKASTETSGLDQIELDMADSLSDDFSEFDDELDDDMVIEPDYLPNTHIEYLDDDEDDDESPEDIEAALFALSQEEMDASVEDLPSAPDEAEDLLEGLEDFPEDLSAGIEELSESTIEDGLMDSLASEAEYVEVSDAEDLLFEALGESPVDTDEPVTTGVSENDDEEDAEALIADLFGDDEEPVITGVSEDDDEADAEALIADLFGDDDMFSEEPESPQPDESIPSSEVMPDTVSEDSVFVEDLGDEESIDAMEAALRSMAEEEFSDSAFTVPEEDLPSDFDSPEEFIIDDIEDSLKQMAAEEFAVEAPVTEQPDDSSAFGFSADVAADDGDEDFDSPEAIEAALLRLAGQDYSTVDGDGGVEPEEDSPSIDVLPPIFDDEEIMGGGQALGLHLEPEDDDFDEDSPELIEAALLRLAREESGGESDPVSNEPSMDDLDAELSSLMDDLDDNLAMGSPEDELVDNLSAELSSDEDDIDPLESVVSIDTVEIPGSVFEDTIEITPDEMAEAVETAPEIFGGEFETEAAPEIFVEELETEAASEIFGEDLAPDAAPEIFGEELAPDAAPEIFGEELAPDAAPEIFGEELAPDAAPEIFGEELASDVAPEIFGEDLAPDAASEIFGAELAPDAASEIHSEELALEAASELFGAELASEAASEIFGEDLAPDAESEIFGEELAPDTASEIFGEELAPDAASETYDDLSLNLGDLVGPPSQFDGFDSQSDEGAVTQVILPEDDDDLGFALDALVSETFDEPATQEFDEPAAHEQENTVSESSFGGLDDLDDILLSVNGEDAPMFTDSFDGLTEDSAEAIPMAAEELAPVESSIDSADFGLSEEFAADTSQPDDSGMDSLSLDLSSLIGNPLEASAQPSFDPEEGAVSRIILSDTGSDDALGDALNALTDAEGFDSSPEAHGFDGLSIEEPGSPLEQALDNVSDDAVLDEQVYSEPVAFDTQITPEPITDISPEPVPEEIYSEVAPVTEDSFFADALADAEEVLSQDSQEVVQDSFVFSPDESDIAATAATVGVAAAAVGVIDAFASDGTLEEQGFAEGAPVFEPYIEEAPSASSGTLDDAFEAAAMVFEEAPSVGSFETPSVGGFETPSMGGFDEPVQEFTFNPEPEFVDTQALQQGIAADGPPEYLFGEGDSVAPAFVQEVVAPAGPRIMPGGVALSPEVENIVGPQVFDFSTIFKSVELIVSNGNSAVIEQELSTLLLTYPDDSKIIFALGALDILRNYHTSGTARLFNAAQRCHLSSDFENEIYVLERLYASDNCDTGLTHTLADRLIAADQSFRAAFVLRESAEQSLEAGATSDAISLLEKAVIADEQDYSTFTLLLQAYRGIGRDSQALEIINTRLAFSPDKLELLMEQSISLYRLGRLDMADEVFDGVIALSADSIDVLLELEAGYDRDDVTTFREKCRERILMIDPANAAVIGKIRKEDRLASLELDVPLLEDLLPYDEPDVEQGNGVFVAGFGDEDDDEIPDTMFTRAISASPRCSVLIEELESLEDEMKIMEDGEQVADRYVAELVRKFLEVGSQISSDDPANAMAFYDRSRSYLNFFDDPAASFLWSEQLERRISSLRELI